MVREEAPEEMLGIFNTDVTLAVVPVIKPVVPVIKPLVLPIGAQA